MARQSRPFADSIVIVGSYPSTMQHGCADSKQAMARKLALLAVDIEGFKSYHGSVRVGARFGHFTCIIGPNGSGKSVVGEAVAFALGGNSKMMRAKNLGSLVNSDLAVRGHHQAAAQVTVHFGISVDADRLWQKEDNAQPAGDKHQQQPSSQGPARPAATRQGGYLGVRRRVTRAGRSDFLICKSDKAPGTLAGLCGSVTAAAGADTTVTVDGRWMPVSPEVLRQQLAEFGIQTQAIDRMVVTQHRQAVNVQDPVKLAGFLELLIGTAAYQEQVEALQAQVRETCVEQDAAEEEVSRLELRRRQLAPEVAKWRKYEAAQQQHAEQQVLVLGQQVGLLKAQAEGLQSQVCMVATALRKADSAQAEAKGEAARLQVEEHAAAEELSAAAAALTKLTRQVEAQQLEQAKLEVRLKSAQRAAKNGAGASSDVACGSSTAEKELRELDAEMTRIRAELERQQRVVHELAEDEAILADRVERLAEQSGSSVLNKLQASLAALKQQLEALDAASAAYKLGLEQHQATASTTEKALHQHAAAEGAAQANRAEGEQAAAQLQQAIEARKGQLCSKEEALQAAQAQLHAFQVHEHQLQQDLLVLDQQLDQVTLPNGCTNGAAERAMCPEQQHSGVSSNQSVAQAVAELTEQAAELPGKFHGRICNVARLAQPQAAAAVNAVLVESCNLSTCFVVSTRAVAQRVVEHFKQHQVGMATCKILDELREPARDTATSDGLLPLQQLVEADTLQAPGSGALLSLMLRNWYLAPDRQAAVSAMTQDRQAGKGRRRNIVTAQGELFKADGELVGARPPPKAVMQFLLSSIIQPLTKYAGTSETEAAEERRQLQQEKAQLTPRLQQCQQRLRQLTAGAEEVAAEAAAMQRELQADMEKCRASQRLLGRELKVQESKLQKRRAALEWELQQAKQAASVAAEGMAAAVQQHQQLEQQLGVLESEYASTAQKLQGGSKLLKERTALEAVRARLEEERLKASALEEQLASVAKRRSQLDKCQRAALAAAAEVSQLEQKLQNLVRSAAAKEEQLQQKGEAVDKLRMRAARLEKDCKVAAKRYEQACVAAQQLQQQLLEQQQALQAVRVRLQQAEAAFGIAEQALVHLAIEQLAAGSSNATVGTTAQVSAASGPLDGFDAEGEVQGGDSEGEGGGKGPKRVRMQSVPARSAGKVSHKQRATGSARRGRGGLESQREGGTDSACEQPPEPDSEYSGGRQARDGGQPRQGGTSTRSHLRRQTVGDSSSDSDHGADSGPGASLARANGEGQPVDSGSDSDFEEVSAPPRRTAKKGASRKAARSSRRLTRSSAASLGQRAEGSTRPGKGGQPVGKQRPQQGIVRSRRATCTLEGQQQDGEEEEAAEAWDEGAVEEALEELERQSRSLQALRASLLEGAVGDDRQAEAALTGKLAELDTLEEQLQRMAQEKDALETERYSRFHSALLLVNTKLSAVYQQLTGGQGDAYCSYIEDKLAAFTEGVTFHVRPDSSRWRPFGILSGGQQALATLALCFAVQAACPSPFYFFDEVDCALDTVNAGRVADYICSQSGTQYLVVSHKPQVYEKADTLVGVYTCGPGSDAVTIHFPRGPQRGP